MQALLIKLMRVDSAEKGRRQEKVSGDEYDKNILYNTWNLI